MDVDEVIGVGIVLIGLIYLAFRYSVLPTHHLTQDDVAIFVIGFGIGWLVLQCKSKNSR